MKQPLLKRQFGLAPLILITISAPFVMLVLLTPEVGLAGLGAIAYLLGRSGLR